MSVKKCHQIKISKKGEERKKNREMFSFGRKMSFIILFLIINLYFYET